MKISHAIALLCGTVSLLAGGQTHASTTIQLYFGELDIPEGSIGILVADAAGNGFATPGAEFTEGSALRRGGRLGVSDDIVIEVLTASSAGFAGVGAGFAATIEAIDYPALGVSEGTPLTLYWFPGITDPEALPGGALWEGYRSDTPGTAASTGFVLPADEGVYTLSQLNAGNGGTFDPSNPGPGFVTGTVGGLPMIETPDSPAGTPGEGDTSLTDAQAGLYFGLASSSGDSSEILGSINNLAVRKDGTFSFALTLDGARHRVKGRFDPATGSFVGQSRSKVPADVSLQLVQTDGGWGIAGTITTDDTEATISLDQWAKYHPKRNPHPDAGRYTLLLPTVEAENTPAAPGWGTLTADPRGRAKIYSKLADGEKFVIATYAGDDHQIGVYAPLYRRYSGGSIGGWLTYRDVAEKSDVDGELRWERNAHSRKRDLAAIDATATMIGSRYLAPPRGDSPLDGETTEGIVVHISGGSTPAAEGARLASLTRSTKIAFVEDGEKLTARISLSKGTFRGSYFNQSEKVTIKFEGVVFQKQSLGLGCLSLPSTPGTVLLAPPE